MNLSKVLVRSFTKSATNNAAKREVAPGYEQIKHRYKAFQVDNDQLVHQRGGTTDTMMFFATVTVNIIGLAMLADVFYKLAFNKK